MCIPEKKDYDRAIADYTEAVQLDPKITSAFVGRGYAHRAKGDLNGAIADYSEAIQLAPKDPIPFTNRANAYYAQGDIDRAIADYGEVIQLKSKERRGLDQSWPRLLHQERV